MVLVTLILLLFLGQLARRAHHRAEHPARAAGRLLRHGRDRHAGEPHLHRRGRLRHRRRLDRHRDGEHLPLPRDARARTDRETASSRGARQVARPISFATLIIGVAFLPLFTMTGVAGVIFSPMAHTYAFAIGAAIILALTLTPALTSKLIPATAEEKDSFATRHLKRLYLPIFKFAIRSPKLALVIGLVPVILGLGAFKALGGEFMPKLEEGNLWIRATLPTSVSLEQSVEVRRADARDPPRLPGARSLQRRQPKPPRGAHGHLAARSPRRRHRRGRLPQHRALRAAPAVRRVEEGRHEGVADRRASRSSSPRRSPASSSTSRR